jgi:hypothetical protein
MAVARSSDVATFFTFYTTPEERASVAGLENLLIDV